MEKVKKLFSKETLVALYKNLLFNSVIVILTWILGLERAGLGFFLVVPYLIGAFAAYIKGKEMNEGEARNWSI